MGWRRVNTWEAIAKVYFPMKAALITTVQDYLGYWYIAGQVSNGHSGCVRCLDLTTYEHLGREPRTSKTVYTLQEKLPRSTNFKSGRGCWSLAPTIFALSFGASQFFFSFLRPSSTMETWKTSRMVARDVVHDEFSGASAKST
jgi:hypothetical protein